MRTILLSLVTTAGLHFPASYLIGMLIALLILAYLFFALVHPEKF